MSTEANKDVVRAFYAQAATGERDAELIAADLRYHGPDMLGDLQGREAFVQLLSGFRAAFPGFETDVHRLVAEGDTVAAWHTHSGTHGGEFAGIPATGKHVTINGLELLRIEDGRIAEFWHMDDFAGMLQQIGAE